MEEDGRRPEVDGRRKPGKVGWPAGAWSAKDCGETGDRVPVPRSRPVPKVEALKGGASPERGRGDWWTKPRRKSW